jgi:hypothetical protein
MGIFIRRVLGKLSVKIICTSQAQILVESAVPVLQISGGASWAVAHPVISKKAGFNTVSCNVPAQYYR